MVYSINLVLKPELQIFKEVDKRREVNLTLDAQKLPGQWPGATNQDRETRGRATA